MKCMAALLFFLTALVTCKPGRPVVPLVDDRNRLDNLSDLVHFAKPDVPLAKDGRIDIYKLVLEGARLESMQVDICYSRRTKTGPTLAEIKAGDYAKFPFQRRKGKVPAKGKVPVMWDEQPDEKGRRLVGYSDGSARLVPREEWTKINPE